MQLAFNDSTLYSLNLKVDEEVSVVKQGIVT